MKIGIDARLINETGIGRYIQNLISELGKTDKDNSYVVFLKREAFDSLATPNSRWQKRLADIPWHSFAEQIVMPWLLVKEHLDLVHIPYFNVPIFYPGKFVITIHDLTIVHFDTGKASTLPLPFYKLRRLGYYLALAVGLARASKIIAVSKTTKQEIIDHFQIDPGKIAVTYEGIDLITGNNKKIVEEPYFLYVGNAYPHKNLEMLIRAFRRLYQGDPLLSKNLKLVLVGKDDYFYRKLSREDHAVFFGQANEAQLQNLYENAVALVFPSLMEGFGLPGLEAMAAGTPVVCSDIPVFHEVYKDAALYFEPKSEKDIVLKLRQIVSEKKLREDLIILGKQQAKQYSWQKLAEETLAAYNSV